MGPRTRSAVASIAVLIWLGFYIWAAVGLSSFIPDSWWAKGIYFGIAGTAWGVPLLPLIKWAGRPR